jgi:uncharacterized membrane protein YfcA
MLLDLFVLITAFFGSLIAGLFGGGAGLIFTPAIFLFLSYDSPNADHLMQTSITTMLSSLILSGLVASFKQQKYKHIDWQVVKWSIPLISLGAIFGCYIMTLISSQSLKYIFATATLLLASKYIYNLYYTKNHINNKLLENNNFIIKYFGSFGLGLLCVISGAASFAVPYYEKIGLNIKSAIGTTTIAVFIYSIFVAIYMIFSGLGEVNLPAGNIGYLNYKYLWLFIIPTIPGVMFGAKLSHFLPEKVLKIIFTILLMIIGISMILT